MCSETNLWYSNKQFILLLFISPILIVRPKNAKSYSRFVGFHLRNRDELPRLPLDVIFLSAYKFLSAITVSKNSSPNKCKKYSYGLESLPKQSTGPGVLIEEKYSYWGDI